MGLMLRIPIIFVCVSPFQCFVVQHKRPLNRELRFKILL